MRHVLASASPRRRRLLGLLVTEFDVVPAGIDETPLVGEAPAAMVQRLAIAKARAVAGRSGHSDDDPVVIAADTTVDLDGRILGTPADIADGRAMLAALSGRTHLVHTGLAVRHRDVEHGALITTKVGFSELEPELVDAYLSTGEGLDKAGAYGIQGLGSALVCSVRGSLSNVIGLPLDELAELLSRFEP